jgi:polyribonucleotide nucleotidyltransferase
MSEKITAQVGDKQITIETGKLAKQADGAVTVQLGETIVLVAAVAATKAKEGQEFFPLTVDYREKAAAAGKFPGGYFKREGRPTEKEILTCRLTDRPIRPLFPKGWYNEVQVQTVVLSADGENDPDILSIIGASAALVVSDIPWDGPLGAVRVGRVNGKLIANPSHSEMKDSDLDLVYVGNATDIVMYEGAAKEISEADFNAALKFGQECCAPLIAAQQELAAKAGKKKREIKLNVVPDEILQEAKALAGDRFVPALLQPGKLNREAACNAIKEEVGAKLVEKFGAEKVTQFVIKDAFYYIQKEAVRSLILENGKRLDGRNFDTVRPITSEVGILPRAHGSALFARGETQAVTLATLGTGDDVQEFDSYTGGENEKRFILHYNFPNFSVGETGRIMGPGRREIGHGALAERSIEPMIPLENYPYTVRITSEIMESNGSTSMAFCLRWHAGPHGCRRSDDSPGRWHQRRHLHRIREQEHFQIPTPDRHHWLGRCVLRHGLQNCGHREGHHRLPTRLEVERHCPFDHGRGRRKSPRCPPRNSCRDGQNHRRTAQRNQQICAANYHPED